MLDEALGVGHRAVGDLAVAADAAAAWTDDIRKQVDGTVVAPLQTEARAYLDALSNGASLMAGALGRLHE